MEMIGPIIIVLLVVAVQLFLPPAVTVGPIWLIPVIEMSGIPIVIGLALVVGRESHLLRVVMSTYLVLLVAASVMNAGLLLVSLLQGSDGDTGTQLLLAGFGVLAINVLSFGLAYWWVDNGGPFARRAGTGTRQDFLFPQGGMPGQQGWQPSLLDYLYTAYTNIIAFSPTDTMPLTHRVKVLFTLQSSTAVLTILVTLSRAINLIPDGAPGS